VWLALGAMSIIPTARALECTHPAGNVAMSPFGDVNGSGTVNVADAMCALLASLAASASGPAPSCLAAAASPIAPDVNCDGQSNVSDVVLTILVALGSPLSGATTPEGCPLACAGCAAAGESSCLIAGACVMESAPNPTAACLACRPELNPSGWSAVNNGTLCDADGRRCASGSCVAAAPSPPLGVSAVAGDGKATVSFFAPAQSGGSPVTLYQVESIPAGGSTSGAASPLVVAGLTNGVAYTFVVRASNAVATSPPSAPSSAVVPAQCLGEPNGTPCNDGDACTSADVCTAGTCAGTGSCTPLPNMPIPPAQYIEFALTPNAPTSTWDLTGNITSGLSNSMEWSDADYAWRANGTAATTIYTNWRVSAGAKTACMWKKYYDAVHLAGEFGIDGWQVQGAYFYYGSYQGSWYFYSGNNGGFATNQNMPPHGPTAGDWVFYCLTSTGAGGSSQLYTATPGATAPLLRHNQASNGSDAGHLNDAGGQRYGALSTNLHASRALYGSFIHFNAHLSAQQIQQVYNATRIHYPGHGGTRPGCGNGQLEGNEVCDGANLDGTTCAELGFGGGGSPSCAPDCSEVSAAGCFVSGGDPLALMPIPPAQYIEFALNASTNTNTWDLTGNIVTGLSNTMAWTPAEKAWTSNGTASTSFYTNWRAGSGAKTACMWKKMYNAANIAGPFGIDGWQVQGAYFYYGSYDGQWYFYSGNNGGYAVNQGTSPSGPRVNEWTFYCLTSTGSGGQSQLYSAVAGDGAPILRHHQPSNGSDAGHANDPGGQRYGVLSSNAHASQAHYGSVIHFNAHLSAAQITAVYDATRQFYPGHNGMR
jgi:hypothetical protein